MAREAHAEMQWLDAPREAILRSGEAHVWTLTTRVEHAVLQRLAASLSSEEQARFARSRDAGAGRDFVVARAALRSLLGSYLAVPAARIELRYGEMGKPLLTGSEAARLNFSVAHADGCALLAFAGVPVGIDVERIRAVQRATRIAERVFPPATQALLAALPAAQQTAAFVAAWTQHEAVVKALGGALMTTRDPLDFAWPAAFAPRQLRAVHEAHATGTWTVAHLPQPAGRAAALVAAGEVERVRLWRFEDL